MNRLGAQAVVKNLPIVQERPGLIQKLIAANVFFYGAYNFVTGPTRVRLSREFTLQPESGIQAVATYHFAHTSLAPMLFNSFVLATVGSQMCIFQGTAAFTRLMIVGCSGASLFAFADMRQNPNQVQAGGLGLSAALITYSAFKAPSRLSMLRFNPTLLVPAIIAYSLMYNDKSVFGGSLAGYAAFLLAL